MLPLSALSAQLTKDSVEPKTGEGFIKKKVDQCLVWWELVGDLGSRLWENLSNYSCRQRGQKVGAILWHDEDDE